MCVSLFLLVERFQTWVDSRMKPSQEKEAMFHFNAVVGM